MDSGRQLRRVLGTIVGGMLLFFAGPITQSTAAPITINFDDLPDSTIVASQYTGLSFTNAIILSAGISLDEFEFPPHSGTNVVSDNNGPMRIDFAAPITAISGFFTYSTTLTLSAFDAADVTVDSLISPFTSNMALSGDPGSTPNEEFTLTSPDGITSLLITGDPLGASFTLDDLTYTPEASVSPPSSVAEPPTLLLLVSMIGLLGMGSLTPKTAQPRN